MMLVFITRAFATEDIYQFKKQTDANRFQQLTTEVRCLVCQNQNIADSGAPLANDLRQKIHDMILANQTDNQIKQYLVSRYGEYILLKPTLHPATAVLWVFPVLGLFILLFLLRRQIVQSPLNKEKS